MLNQIKVILVNLTVEMCGNVSALLASHELLCQILCRGVNRLLGQVRQEGHLGVLFYRGNYSVKGKSRLTNKEDISFILFFNLLSQLFT